MIRQYHWLDAMNARGDCFFLGNTRCQQLSSLFTFRPSFRYQCRGKSNMRELDCLVHTARYTMVRAMRVVDDHHREARAHHETGESKTKGKGNCEGAFTYMEATCSKSSWGSALCSG